MFKFCDFQKDRRWMGESDVKVTVKTTKLNELTNRGSRDKGLWYFSEKEEGRKSPAFFTS